MGAREGVTRRGFLAGLVAAGSAALVSWAGPIIERAYAADPAGVGGLDDIEHFVLLMQENRSFDHYFGTLSGVRGFAEQSVLWQQAGGRPSAAHPEGVVAPFRLDTTRAEVDGACVNDPDHSWKGMHRAFNGGANDQWMPMAVDSVGPQNAPVAMGYHTRADLPVHYDLADAFTLCDHYHCSVLGPTDPNRLYWVSATIDPTGEAGGPLVETPAVLPRNVYRWRTFPENLSEAGVSWKIYNNRDVGPVSSVILDGMLGCFQQGADENSELARRGRQPVFPHDLAADVAANQLPAVSWVIPSVFECEHPALPPALGAVGIMQVLDILTSNPAVWEKTALIVSYDENGGFFDHVIPPTPPPGTPGEYLSGDVGRISAAAGIAGPIGLGYRVPCLVISPYSRGGLVTSQTFDHTSQLRLLERRFDVAVPNLTPWRRGVTGDMTAAFDFASAPNAAPAPIAGDLDAQAAAALQQCGPNVVLGSLGKGVPYPIPPYAMPGQEGGTRRRPSGAA